MTGRGIDRHLLGLRCMMREGERHDLFEDELFARSQTWELSTSGLSAGDQFRGTGFGTAEPDGYGVNCECGSRRGASMCANWVADMAGPELIKFGIESKMSCPETSTSLFKYAIQTALLDMQALCTTTTQAQL